MIVKIMSQGFEKKSLDSSCSFNYTDVFCLHTYRFLLAFEKNSFFFFKVRMFIYLDVKWVRRYWGGLAGREQATRSITLPLGAGSLFQGYSTLIMRDGSQREQWQNEDGLQKMRFVSRGQRNWSHKFQAAFSTLPYWKWLRKLLKNTVAQGPSQWLQTEGLGSSPWALAWGQRQEKGWVCMWVQQNTFPKEPLSKAGAPWWALLAKVLGLNSDLAHIVVWLEPCQLNFPNFNIIILKMSVFCYCTTTYCVELTWRII